MLNTEQADGESHEDQFLSFLINTLDDQVSLALGTNAEIDSETIYEVFTGACADGASVYELCENSEDSPGKTILYYPARSSA